YDSHSSDLSLLLLPPPRTEIYTPSLHDALPISEDYLNLYLCDGTVDENRVENYERALDLRTAVASVSYDFEGVHYRREYFTSHRSEEHTSELQSRFDLVCRLLLEKKKHQQTFA